MSSKMYMLFENKSQNSKQQCRQSQFNVSPFLNAFQGYNKHEYVTET